MTAGEGKAGGSQAGEASMRLEVIAVDADGREYVGHVVNCAACGAERRPATEAMWPSGAEQASTGEWLCSDREACDAVIARSSN